jgi:hypothetical protein
MTERPQGVRKGEPRQPASDTGSAGEEQYEALAGDSHDGTTVGKVDRRRLLTRDVAVALMGLVALSLAVIGLIDSPSRPFLIVDAVTLCLLLFAVDEAHARSYLRKTIALALVATTVLLATGFAAWVIVQAPGTVPTPDPQTLIPTGYTVQHVSQWHGDGGGTPEVVIASTGPKSRTASPADLQVFQWIWGRTPGLGRWQPVFDAARWIPDGIPDGSSPALPANGDDSVNAIFPAKLDVTPGDQLVFETSFTYGANSFTHVGVLGYLGGRASILDWRSYTSDLPEIEPVGEPSHQRLKINAHWRTPVDSLCCPLRPYEVQLRYNGTFAFVYSDDRPYLGVRLADTANGVVRVDPRSPANGVLQVGDMLVDVDGQPNPRGGIVDAIGSHRAGDQVVIHFERRGQFQAATIKLDSLATPFNNRLSGRSALPESFDI